jgi:hypothetical protein
MAPAGGYTLTAELAGFDRRERVVQIDSSCVWTPDLQMTLTGPASGTARAIQPVATPQAGRRGSSRFEALAIERQAAGAADDTFDSDVSSATLLALPPGFSTEQPTDEDDCWTGSGY